MSLPYIQLFGSGVLANQTDEHIRCHSSAALLFDFGAELFDFLGQLLLLVLNAFAPRWYQMKKNKTEVREDLVLHIGSFA